MLYGIKCEIKNETLYLKEIKDINDFIKIRNALINLEKNSYKESSKIYLDISDYLKNSELFEFKAINNKWYIKNIKSIDFIHVICTYKLFNKSSQFVELDIQNLDKKEVIDIIKQYISKDNYNFIMNSIMLKS